MEYINIIREYVDGTALAIGYIFLFIVSLGVISLLKTLVLYGKLNLNQAIVNGEVIVDGVIIYRAEPGASLSVTNGKVKVNGKVVARRKYWWQKEQEKAIDTDSKR